uniref:Uncharacterized protein n=1 Tax=Avena sativa TaxID=4498 RepID=A0ACD5Z401_AVESA
MKEMTTLWHARSQLPTLLLMVLHVAIAEKGARPITRPGCPDKCGDISIPFPFGIKPGCFLEGFKVTCNVTFNPPRLFISGGRWEVLGRNYTVGDGARNYTTVASDYSNTTGLVELSAISAVESLAWAYSAVSSLCSTNSTQVLQTTQHTNLDPGGPLSLSGKRNLLVGVGYAVEVNMFSSVVGVLIGPFHYRPTCSTIKYGSAYAEDGSCSGQGCCESPLDSVPNVGVPVNFQHDFEASVTPAKTDWWDVYPCSYGMLVDSTFYNFSKDDIVVRDVLPTRFPRGVPMVLDFAISNGSCPPVDGPTACVSGNSYCANATRGSGYVCKCLEHYDGNPYISDGCQDVDECGFITCPSGSECTNTLGGYDCPCKPGMKRNGKEGPCTEKFPLPAKLAVGLASLIVIVVLMVMAYQVLKLNRFYKQNGGPILEEVQNIRIYTQKDLKKITNNYKDIIGQGHFGKVYMGTLKDMQKVAVKKTIKVNEDRKKEFIDEVIIQSGMRHKNIARLLGCCLQMDVPMLVYEFVEKGSLYDVLFKLKDDFPADERLRVATGSAEGLSYMHSSGKSTIRHGDVKSANILLDESFSPKVSDFGTSKVLAKDKSENAELVIGDMGYIDPVYMAKGTLTQKSDVYSFGIVLIELITRRPATYDVKRSYVTNFVQAFQDNRASEFVDNDITGVDDIELLQKVSEVALKCLKSEPQERPDMREVEHRLQIIGKPQQLG